MPAAENAFLGTPGAGTEPVSDSSRAEEGLWFQGEGSCPVHEHWGPCLWGRLTRHPAPTAVPGASLCSLALPGPAAAGSPAQFSACVQPSTQGGPNESPHREASPGGPTGPASKSSCKAFAVALLISNYKLSNLMLFQPKGLQTHTELSPVREKIWHRK